MRRKNALFRKKCAKMHFLEKSAQKVVLEKSTVKN